MALNNSSLSFNGVDHRAIAAANTATIRNLGSFGFSAWFKVGDNATNTNQHAYVERQGTGNLIRFRFTPVRDTLQFGFSAVDGVADTAYTYKTKWDDHWHLATFSVRLGGERPTYEITLDGVTVLEGTVVVPPDTQKISDTAPLAVTMGNWGSFPANTAWHGLLDDVALFDNGLNQGEVNTYFSSKKRWDEQQEAGQPVDQNMIAYWPMDENTGTSTADFGSTVVDTSGTNPPVHGPAVAFNLYKGASLSATLWTIDRPYMGNGLSDTQAPTTPTAPTTSNANADGFTASWGLSTDNVWVQFYEVQVSEFANFASYTSYDTGRALSRVVTGLLPATNYYWRVRAFDAALNASAYAATQSLTTPPVGDIYPPSPPTNLTSSFVTHSSFRLSYTPSVSMDTVGYRVDISEYSDFRSFLTDYRNQDIGNVSYVDIFGVRPLTSYYVRLRAYDAFDNESEDSVALRVNTPRQPDITPPLVATLYEATAITATTATLHWAEGVDDTRVLGYYVDISTTPTFTNRVLANNIYWDAMDVGGVIDYRVEGLTPNTQYYYRVRAYDDAGNVAPNVEEGMSFFTRASTIYEGGTIDTEEYRLDWRENTDVRPNVFYITSTRSAYLSFDLSALVGSVDRATLRFMPRAYTQPNTYGAVTIRAMQGDIDDTPTGATIETTITQLGEYMEVDVTSLISTTDPYVIQIASATTNGFTGYIDAGIEIAGFNTNEPTPPSLLVSSDPLTSTDVLESIITITDPSRNNLCINPSFEVDTSGWTGLAGATLSRILGGTDGSYTMRVTGITAFSGVAQSGNFADIQPNRPITASADLVHVSGGNAYRLALEAFDALGTSLGTFATKNMTLYADRQQRVFVSSTTPANTTQIRLIVYNTSGVTYTFDLDNVLIEESAVMGAAFTGNTSNAEWVGPANNSASRVYAPTIRVESPYLGDNNQNNSVQAFFKHKDETEWIPVRHAVTVNRSLKQYTTYLGDSYGNYNLVRNPSFEVSDVLWTGGTRGSAGFYVGEYGYLIDTSPFLAQYTPYIPVVSSQVYSAQARVRANDQVSVTMRLHFHDVNGNLLSTATAESIYGDSTQVLTTLTATAPANAVDVRLSFVGNGAFAIDAIQFNEGPYQPYRDGDTLDGVWEGVPHLSTTGIQILNETEYDIRLSYTDPDGFFDTTTDSALDVNQRIETPAAPDDAIHLLPMELEATETTIEVAVPYIGDDNNDSTVRLEFRRTDLSTWSELRPLYHRDHKHFHATIPNLRSGTSYTVRAIVSDPDGVFGAVNNTITGEVTTHFVTNASAGEPHISFGGFILQGNEEGKIGVTYHDAFGFPERRVRVEDLPRLDGATEMQSLWGKRRITIRGYLSGDSRAELDTLQTSLKRGLSNRLQRLIIDTLSRRGRFYYATCESLSIDEDAQVNIRHLTWQAEFVCADPFAYDVSETAIPKFTTPNNNSVAVTNAGDVSVSPRFEITTTSAFPVSFTIINTSTGERIAPKTTIVSGNRIVIDCERRSVTKNGVEIDYAGSFPRLASGGNILNFEVVLSRTATSTTTVNAQLAPPTIAVETRWRNKYL